MRGVKERSIPYRTWTAERNDVCTGLLIPRTPETGMISAGVDRDAKGSREGECEICKFCK